MLKSKGMKKVQKNKEDVECLPTEPLCWCYWWRFAFNALKSVDVAPLVFLNLNCNITWK